jgi:hypothetical protein
MQRLSWFIKDVLLCQPQQQGEQSGSGLEEPPAPQRMIGPLVRRDVFA